MRVPLLSTFLYTDFRSRSALIYSFNSTHQMSDWLNQRFVGCSSKSGGLRSNPASVHTFNLMCNHTPCYQYYTLLIIPPCGVVAIFSIFMIIADFSVTIVVLLLIVFVVIIIITVFVIIIILLMIVVVIVAIIDINIIVIVIVVIIIDFVTITYSL